MQTFVVGSPTTPAELGQPQPGVACAGRTQPQRIAVIGGGFTGSMLAAHLLRNATVPTEVILVERGGEPGTGIAYSTPNSAHLLNVRAYNMSAYPDDPRHFLRWLWAQDDGDSLVPPSGHAFVSRGRYGAYIRSVLEEARVTAPRHASLEVVCGEAVDLEEDGDGVRLRLAGGGTLHADLAALCIGHFPPSPPRLPAGDVYASKHYIGDPWDLHALAGVDRDAPVLILGTGLTMVDTVLTLADQGHRGPVIALSRRGLLPLRHEEVRPFKSFVSLDVLPQTVLDVLIALKADVHHARDAGLDWRSAFDALRPHHHRIWQHLPLDERRRFLRHARPFWDVHRHRLAPTVADRIEAAVASGALTVRAGRLRGLALAGDGIAAEVALRAGRGVETLTVGTLVNATGTECDYARIRHPLVRALLGSGLARPDELQLGLDVSNTGALIGRDGAESARLFAFGPVAKAPFWEMTAVPELRNQCSTAGRHLAGLAENSSPDAMARPGTA